MSAAGAISLNWRRDGHASSDDLCVVSDGRLVAAAKIGHKGAFDYLYQRHAEKMLRITYRITRNRQDAEDAVQECFLNAFLHLKNFDGRSRFSTWLTRISTNVALMKLRKNHASREVPIGVSVETSELCSEHQVSDFSPNPEELCTKSEREATLRDAIAKLRPSIRQALEIHKLQERSLEETATVLGVSVVAVKARVFHARAALRRTPQLRFALGKPRASFTPGSIKVQPAELR
jgi:RNA polymerase sigma factor (sigma-70 family)